MWVPYQEVTVDFTRFDDSNIVEFPVNGNVHTRQKVMYTIKKWCTEQGLKNGQDYLFRPVKDNTHIPVWFREQCYASMLAMVIYAR